MRLSGAIFGELQGSVCIQLLRSTAALTKFVVIDDETATFDLSRVEFVMHDDRIGFHL